MKIVKNLLAAAILASAIASTTYAGDVGFPPVAPPPPPADSCLTCSAPVVGPNGATDTSAPSVAPEDESTTYLLALALLVALSLLPSP
jgi:hypothetical protein